MKPQIYIEEKRSQNCEDYVILHPGADCSPEQLARAKDMDTAGKAGQEMDHQDACRLARRLRRMGYEITMDRR